MTGQCAVCGHVGPVEEHHIAGRANHATATITLCVPCHRSYLTPWHRSSGIPLKPGATALVKDWSLAVGMLHVLELVARLDGLPQALATVRWVERMAVEMFGDAVPSPTTSTRPLPQSASGSAVIRDLARMVEWFTDDPSIRGWFHSLAEDGL